VTTNYAIRYEPVSSGGIGIGGLARLPNTPLWNQAVRIKSRSPSSRYPAYLLPVFRKAKADVFEFIASELDIELRYVSSSRDMVRNENFRRLLDQGPDAVHFIISRLKSGDIRPYWFPALKRLTGADPIDAAQRGYLDQMAQSWVSWANQNLSR
jgi:hypothetical protein